ncbi:Bug family tripartite tricarboxylate transporter substrate binding protein [Neoroseomonas soli]|uniref:Tripartite tricarboxylate transporter substrate binding protein n=1 Tax=Neoroseomonas soli TaxID=1081025 RepID=A0A9X9WR48_9PROT|nr:tripartite tricarboxylate transporter substrate binding protein [Neoroseomonas soli]MBR0669627.1 tripartite tricarboxylate transporter substrate binding protein [Neoroseomonas soli]
MKRRTIMLGAAPAVLAARSARGQDGFPTRTVRILVPVAPGGITDALARLVATGLQQRLGQTVVVENRPGGNGIVASEAVVRSEPDGHTMVLVIAAHAINPSLTPNLPIRPLEDLAPVTQVAGIPLVLVTSAALPPRTLAEFVAYARAAPEPLLYASSGAGSGAHIAGEMFARAIGAPMQNVIYRGTAQSLPDLFSGRVAMILDTVQTMLPHIREGRLRGLAICADQRWPAASDIPTTDEAGLPGFRAGSWAGLLAPTRTPRVVLDRVQRETADVLRQPETQQRFLDYGVVPVGSTPQAFDAFIRTEAERYRRVIREAGIRAD